MPPSPETFFKARSDGTKTLLAHLSPGERIAFLLLMLGAFLPTMFLATGPVRPAVYLAVAFQLGCVSGLSYMRWRLPAFRGSFLTFAIASLTCLFTLAAAMSS